ncbi:MAG: hypothetical protein HRT74_07610 [Flavobacteriales bacterium]|nr:hypothetical protein [Flavobacteriales bacterium]
MNWKALQSHRNHAGPIYCLSEGRKDGEVLTGSSDGFVAAWSLSEMSASKFAVNVEKPVFSVFVDRKYHRLLIGTHAGEVHVINYEEKREERLLATHSLGVFAIAMIPEEDWIVTGGGKGILNIWNRSDYDLVRSIPLHPSKIRAIERWGNELWVGQSDGSIHVLDLPYLNSTSVLTAHESGTYALIKHPTKELILSSGGDGLLKAWNQNGEELLSVQAHYQAIYGMSCTKDNLVTASRDKSFKTWDLQSLDHQSTVAKPGNGEHTHSINAIHYDESSSRLITVGDDRRIVFWEDEKA